MRVLYCSRGYSSHDLRFLEKMVESGLEVAYLRQRLDHSGQESRPLPEAVKVFQDWAGLYGDRIAHWPGLIRSLREVVDRFQPDLVHAGPLQEVALFPGLLGFQPLVSMSWGWDLLLGTKTLRGRILARRALKRSDVLVCDCETLRGAAVGLGFPRDRTVCFPWGVDLDHFRPGEGASLRERLGWQGQFILLSTRAWEPMYGIETLIKGFLRAAAVESRLRLLMLGEGSLAGWIRGELERGGMAERVAFPGQVPFEDLPSCYQAADLYLSASHSDGSSISLLEAMASGLPVVVSDIPGNLEWVEEGVNGWTFSLGDSRSLAEFLIRASTAGEGLKRMAAESRRIAEQRADWKRNSDELLTAYRLAMNGSLP